MPVATVLPAELESFSTPKEICGQPEVWRGFAPQLQSLAEDIRTWVAARDPDEIWFCGAGTSAFIGETLAAHLNRAPGPARFRAVPTTDLVACPRNYLRDGVRPLVVSFGRSGNSSESLGTLDLLAALAPRADRLHITCNGTSALANPTTHSQGELRIIVLPPETGDQGFAMTSSYTTMLLTALACFDPRPPAAPSQLLPKLADAAATIIADGFSRLPALGMPDRAVFLGAGALTGAARESALKVLELTAGQVETSWDSPLGFRHGPKAVVNGRTLVFLLGSADPHTALYDADLAAEIATQFGNDTILRLGRAESGAAITVPDVGGDAWNAVLYVLVAQVLAVIWSRRLGHDVDDPFAGRNLTRVVSGVRLYPAPKTGPRVTGGLDVGGTKVETCLFDADMTPIERRRAPIGKSSYEDLLASVGAELRWLEERAGFSLPVGIGLPGLLDAATGKAVTANLPATGNRLAADLTARFGRAIAVENDCKCFALSEANGGAGQGHRTVFGLILGTGVGGGVTHDGRLIRGLNGLPGEVGHIPLPADLILRHGLPVATCGCGREGCYETLLSGPGLIRLAAHVTGETEEPASIFRRAAAAEPGMARVVDLWLGLLAELIHTVQMTIDADCVVLGGGLSRAEGLAARLAQVFDGHKLPGVRSPVFAAARFGDASGVRGAALLARELSPAELA